MPLEKETVDYRAKSALTSATILTNIAMFVATILMTPQFSDLANSLPYGQEIMAILIPLVNIGLRFKSVRPVALIAPGDTKPVAVEKL